MNAPRMRLKEKSCMLGKRSAHLETGSFDTQFWFEIIVLQVKTPYLKEKILKKTRTVNRPFH